MRALLFSCFVFLVLVGTIFTTSECSALAQKIDEPVVTYSEPRIVGGDSERCQIISVSNNNQLAINLPNANAASQDSKQDSLKCRVELDATMQLNKGWYFHSVEHTVSGTIIRSHGTKAMIAIRSTFQKKPVLQFRETAADGLVARSKSISSQFYLD